MKTELLKRIAMPAPIPVVLLFLFIRLVTHHPDEIEKAETHCEKNAPLAPPGKLKVMSWNVQFMAGKKYVFFFDMPDNAGPDNRPSAADISSTLSGVIQLIGAENPDVVLLQEVDRFASRTDNRDQLSDLMKALGERYPCYATAYYWKNSFIPHPRIMGSSGLSLVTLSRYRISDAKRYQLPLTPLNVFSLHFQPKRAVLAVSLAGSGSPALLNTHLEAFTKGTDIMSRQVSYVVDLLRQHENRSEAFIIGGDFNLLPDLAAFNSLPAEQRIYFNPRTELTPLIGAFPSVPTRENMSGKNRSRWFTHFPNDPRVKNPDRTIDYLFHSRSLKRTSAAVLREGALNLSDHFPVLAEFEITADAKKRKK